MEKRLINLLTIDPYFLVMSKATKKPYIDANYSCYMFSSKREANGFVGVMEGTYIDDKAKNYTKDICSLLYSYGVSCIHIKTAKNDDFVDIPVEQEDIRKQYYNGFLNSRICRLKQTRKAKYLREMYKAKFIVPILIDKRKRGQYPSLHYCYALMGDKNPLYVLFSTLREFDEWNKTQKETWEPLELYMDEFQKIRDNHAVVINPMSDMLILTDEQVREMDHVKETD